MTTTQQRTRRVRANASPEWLSWRGFLYYGEVFGFLAAWVIGVATIIGSSPGSNPGPPSDRIASAAPPTR